MMYIKHRKIFDYINKNLYIQVNENIPSLLRQGIVLAESIPLFVHTNVSQKRRGTLDWNYNFGTLFYESVILCFCSGNFTLKLFAVLSLTYPKSLYCRLSLNALRLTVENTLTVVGTIVPI